MRYDESGNVCIEIKDGRESCSMRLNSYILRNRWRRWRVQRWWPIIPFLSRARFGQKKRMVVRRYIFAGEFPTIIVSYKIAGGKNIENMTKCSFTD